MACGFNGPSESGESGCGEIWQEEVWWPCMGTTDCMGQLVLKVSVSIWTVLTISDSTVVRSM